MAIVIFIILYRNHAQNKDFDMTPRDHTGQEVEDDEEDTTIVEDDSSFDQWQSTWEMLLGDIGLLDIRDGMIEYETGDNSRMFIMLAEVQQSNPYLKTDAELAQDNALMEIFLNTLTHPLKISSESQKVEMTDFLKTVKDHSQYIRNSTPKMKEYAKKIIDNTLDYQHETDRFENRCYMQFMTLVQPDEVYGDTPEMLEKQIHEKAQEKLLRQIANGDGILRRADHSLQALDTFGLMEVIYKTLNRESSVKIRLEDIFRNQNFSLYTTARQSDRMFKEVQQKIQIEQDLVNHARDAMWLQQQAENARILAKGKDYYDNNSDNVQTPDDTYKQPTQPPVASQATTNSSQVDSTNGLDIKGLDDLD